MNKVAIFGQKNLSRDGGVELVVQELAKRLVRDDYSVTCYNRYDSTSNDTSNEYKQIIQKNVLTIQKKGLAAVSSSFSAGLHSAFGNYDVVHIQAEGPAFFSLLPKLFKKKVVVTIHGLDWQREKWKKGFGSKFIRQGEKNAVKYADEIIVLSKNVQEYFKETYNRDTHYIPNGVSKPNLVELDLIEKFNLEKDSYFLYLGRLVPEKGIHYLIQSYNELNTTKKLVIAGGSSDTDSYVLELKKLAKNNENIIFTDFVQGKLLEELYSNAYVYVLPSDLEGMPLSLLEAMSYGNCCVVSNISECTEVVEDKAIVFKKSDILDLKNTLQKLSDNPNLVQSYKDTATDFICNKYSWDKMVKQTEELYKK